VPTIAFEYKGKTHRQAIAGDSVTVGRAKECGVRIPDKSASRTHCEIVKTAAGYMLVDLESHNGTFLNGEKVTEHPLAPGDVLKIGNLEMRFEADGAGAPPAPAVVPEAGPQEEELAPAEAAPQVTIGVAAPVPAPAPAPRRPEASVPEPAPVLELEREPAVTVDVGGPASKPSAGERKPTARRAPSHEPPKPAPKSAMSAPLIAGIVIGVLAILTGVGFYLRSASDAVASKERDVRARLKKEVDEINKMAVDDTAGRDERTQKVLADAEFVKYAGDSIKKIAVEAEKLHVLAEADKKARSVMEPFLAGADKVMKDPAELDAKAETLFEEARGLFEKYRETSYGAKLVNLTSQLRSVIEAKRKKSSQ